MWNLKNKINKLTDTENKLTVARWEGVGEMGEKGKEIMVLKLPVTK